MAKTEKIKPLFIKWSDDELDIASWFQARAAKNGRTKKAEAIRIFSEERSREAQKTS